MSDTQRTLSELADEHGTADTVGREPGQKPHLQKPKPKGNSSTFDAEKDREFWCTACDHRVTVGADGATEYGHGRDCEHKVQWDTLRDMSEVKK